MHLLSFGCSKFLITKSWEEPYVIDISHTGTLISMKDFFISYNRHDQQWAEWVAWTLEAAGYTVMLQMWDFTHGENFALDMNKAVAETQTTIAILSESFLYADYERPEWAAAFVHDSRQLERKLMPLLIEHCPLTGVLAKAHSVDLVGLPENEAKALLLEALQARVRLASKPYFPGVVTQERTPPSFEFDFVVVNAAGREMGRSQGQAKGFTENLGFKHPDKEALLEMVSIPGGRFLLGSPETEKKRSRNEGPQQSVKVNSFFMGKYPVTQEQWRVVAGLPKLERDLNPHDSRYEGSWYEHRRRPVACVSWWEAVEFCARLSRRTRKEYRLPTEIEWEYACRAGTTTPFHFGKTLTSDLANYKGWETYASEFSYASELKGEWLEETIDVGSFPANAFGLYDMHGNVEEWCLNSWDVNYEDGPSSDFMLLRGGSYNSPPVDCRSACRNYELPDYCSNEVGFRVVC